jgi:hypothetical protein
MLRCPTPSIELALHWRRLLVTQVDLRDLLDGEHVEISCRHPIPLRSRTSTRRKLGALNSPLFTTIAVKRSLHTIPCREPAVSHRPGGVNTTGIGGLSTHSGLPDRIIALHPESVASAWVDFEKTEGGIMETICVAKFSCLGCTCMTAANMDSKTKGRSGERRPIHTFSLES